MKNILCLLLVISSLTIFSQEDNIEIIDPVETQAEFDGGIDAMWCYFESGLNVKKINSRNLSGRMFFEFVIDTLGKVTDIKANPDHLERFNLVSDSIIENDIIYVLKYMPAWTPAFQSDKKVRSKFTLQVNIPYNEYKCAKFINDTTVYLVPDTYADFYMAKGDSTQSRIKNFIYSRLTWPSQDDCSGKVYIRFIIEKDGSATNHEILRGMCKAFDEEALRVVKLMTEWIPGYINNKPVRSYMIVPVSWKLL